jgi:hypothetical protein
MSADNNQCVGYWGRAYDILYMEVSGNPQVLDYDCDGTFDIADNHPADPDDRGKNAGVLVCENGPCPYVKNPVNIATGNKYEEVLDMSLSTPGLPLEFRRSYNNQLACG